MICRAILDSKKRDTNMWNDEEFHLLRRVKNSIVGNKNTPHFGADGKYFSFGINILYNIDKKDSSIGTYSVNPGKK